MRGWKDMGEISDESSGCIALPASMVRSWMTWSVYWEWGWKTSKSAVNSRSSQLWQHVDSLGSGASNCTTPNPDNRVIREWLRFPSIPEAWTWRTALFWAATGTRHSLPKRMNKAGTLWVLSWPLASWICIASHPSMVLYGGSHIPLTSHILHRLCPSPSCHPLTHPCPDTFPACFT